MRSWRETSKRKNGGETDGKIWMMKCRGWPVCVCVCVRERDSEMDNGRSCRAIRKLKAAEIFMVQ